MRKPEHRETTRRLYLPTRLKTTSRMISKTHEVDCMLTVPLGDNTQTVSVADKKKPSAMASPVGPPTTGFGLVFTTSPSFGNGFLTDE